jgi:hypothetical protein
VAPAVITHSQQHLYGDGPALHSNSDFDDYFTYHAEQEHRRVHRARYRDNFRLGA